MRKDWQKIDDNVYRSKKPSFGENGTLYKYIWIDFKNNIRINDGELKSSRLNMDIVQKSYVYYVGKTYTNAKKELSQFLIEHE